MPDAIALEQDSLTIIPPSATATALGMVSAFAGTSGLSAPREAFLTAIGRLQRVPFSWSAVEAGPQLAFAGEDDLATAAIRHIVADPAAEVEPYAAREPTAVRANVDQALARLRALDPETHATMTSLVGSLPCGRLPGLEGGSISSLIGVIWIGLDADADADRYAELILHEYVHQTLFLEDMVNGVFLLGEEELADDDALVTTAIQRRQRGYDKGLHSAFVALSLSRLWRRLGDGAEAERYLSPSVRTVRELSAKDRFLSPHGQSLLGLLSQALESELHSSPVG